MASSTIKRTGFESSLSLSLKDNSNIFCHSFNGGVKWTKKCSCILYNLNRTFLYLLKGSVLKYRHLPILILNCLDRGEVLFIITSSTLLTLFGQTYDNNLSPSVVSLAVFVASSCASSIRSPYLCSKHLISWIKHDAFLSRYSFSRSKFFNIAPP